MTATMHRSRAPPMAWNVFQHCTLLRGLGSIMILLVLAFVGLTYYTVVVADYDYSPDDGGHSNSLAVLILFHLLLVMLLWSYFSVVLTDPGGVPPNWISNVDEENGSIQLTSLDFTSSDLSLQQSATVTDPGNSRIRHCRKCNQSKPPRCHHCSVCGRCILKMDHHCLWVVNCIGAFNYKFFLLFLFYTFLETSLVTLSMLSNFIAFFNSGKIPGTPATLVTTFLTTVLNLAFALSVTGLLLMHISLVRSNTTTIEANEKKTTPKWRYDLGGKKNFEQVFGTEKKYWLVPMCSEEDLRRMATFYGLGTNPDDAQD